MASQTKALRSFKEAKHAKAMKERSQKEIIPNASEVKEWRMINKWDGVAMLNNFLGPSHKRRCA